ncbi:MAG TPA: EAL domain-containing protein [Vicinamibacterales bacterium]|nr:EAL domain-containing protein [Vicinamibacterales bacterium]
MNTGRLLVVDDDEMNLEIVRRRLSRLGFDVVVSTDGPGALERLQQTDLDLVLLDIEMPQLSGIELLRRLRETYSPTELPVIIVSGKHDSDTVVEALGLGANDYVTKPVDMAVTSARIQAQLARRSEGTAARTNKLSGLPNRAGLDHWWTHRVDKDQAVALITLNLDRFRVINNGLGHETGDKAIADVGRRLRGVAPRGSFVGHPYGDEFIVVVEGADETMALEVAAGLLREVHEPFAPSVVPITITASAGISLGDGHRRIEELVGEADAALYRAKTEAGGHAILFQPELRSRAAERLRLETELQAGLTSEAIRIEYQPIVALSDGSVAGFEALARWNHPTRGEVPPSAFIPLAEETGLILSLGHQVLTMACRQLREWQALSILPPDGSLAVNVSAAQLHDPGWIDTVQAIIAETGVDPKGLKIEITEGMLVADLDRARELLGKLQQIGVQIALDDFGTGYSSLTYLQHLPLNWIKVDRSFVSELADVSRKSRIVQSVIDLASKLGIDVVAEGIESARDYNWLRVMGCRYGQGYFLSRSLPADEAVEFALSRRGRSDPSRQSA